MRRHALGEVTGGLQWEGEGPVKSSGSQLLPAAPWCHVRHGDTPVWVTATPAGGARPATLFGGKAGGGCGRGG
eukprot:12930739-Prorocentrum_lima.AAC.1